MQFEKLLENLEKYALYIVLALFPVFILGTYATPYIVPKEVFLAVGASVIIILWVVRMIVKGSLSFAIGKFDLGVLLIALVYLITTFIATPNKMEGYLLPGTTTFVLGGAVLYFLINQFDAKTKKTAGIALFSGVLLLALSVLLTTLGAFSKIPQLPAFVKDASFNPIGGSIPSIILLAIFSVYSIGILLKEKDNFKKLFFGVSLAVLIFTLVVLVGSILPGKSTAPKFVSTQTSWEVLVETLKRSPVTGIGPSNYLTAFNLFRPVSYNQSALWQVRFTTASNYYFTAITETGFLGLFAIAVFLIAVYRFAVKDLKFTDGIEKVGESVEKLSLILALVLFAILPVAAVLIVYLFALLAIFSKSESHLSHLNISSTDSGLISSRIPAIIVGIPFLVGIAALVFFGGKVLAAEATFKKALDALTKNDAKSTYTLMQSAISQNAKVDRYHASFAQVDMALASSLASKKDITDTDRATITQLVQQAIAEGKNAVILNPQRSGNWEVLAQIYRSIMPFAQGADQFTIQTYTQAIALDPTNPNLRIALGGVYYALGKYDDAIASFKLAVLAKNDLANAHYNLAIAYREKKDYDNAITEMNNVLALVNKNSQDYTLAQNVLADLQKNKAATAGSSDNLKAPQKNATSNVKPPINLPSEATPPAATNQ